MKKLYEPQCHRFSFGFIFHPPFEQSVPRHSRWARFRLSSLRDHEVAVIS